MNFGMSTLTAQMPFPPPSVFLALCYIVEVDG